MGRLRAARLWLGAAGVGAGVFVAALTGMLHSCQVPAAAAAYVDSPVAQLRADYFRAYPRSTSR